MALKILIAEDDRHTRRILEHIFTKDPHFADRDVQLLLAADGEEALRLFERESPDIVISDLLMPKLDGFALCRAIRKLPQGKSVPLIVTSAIYKETALLNRMREELQVEFFAKPFQVRELLRGVQSLLDQHGRGKAATPQNTKDEQHQSILGPSKPTQGSLADRPLGALVFDALETQVTGELTLRRGKILKKIYFLLGSPAAAESNVRTESLPHYLLVKHLLDENQVSKLLATAKQSGQTLLQTLATLGWLTETDILRHYTALVKLRIINSLRWQEGSFSFVPGDTFSDRLPHCTIDAPGIVLLGFKRVTNPDEVARQLEPQRRRPLLLTMRGERYQEVFLKVFGDALFHFLPGRPTIEDLAGKGLDPLTIYTHVHALLQTEMAKFGQAAEQARAVEAPAALDRDPLDLENIRKATMPTGPTIPTDDDVIHRELFGEDEISVVTSLPEETDLTKTSSEDSQVVEIPISVEIDTKPQRIEEVRRKILSAYLGLHDKSYYELLGVRPDAGPNEIHDAYRLLMDEFDPEKYADLDLGPDHPKLEEVVHSIRQAYHVLSDASLRKDYDASLSAKSAPRADPLEAELRFREGEQHLRQGRCKDAVESFRSAAEIDPDVADHHAYLAWAQYCASENPGNVRQQAIALLQQALEMDPDLISGHMFLGRIAVDVGDAASAMQHLERVLELEPSHVDAFDLLARLLEANQDWQNLERVHRKILQRIGTRDDQRAVALWKSLAKLYAEHLGAADKAAACLEMALKIAPDDTEASQMASNLAATPASWDQVRDDLLGAWAHNPGNVEPVEELFHRALSKEQWEEAYLLASGLVALSSSDTSASAFYRRYQPRFLQRIRRELGEGVMAALRHPADDPEVASLFAALAPVEENLDLGVSLPSATPWQPGSDHLSIVYEYLSFLLDRGGEPVSMVDQAVAIPVPAKLFGSGMLVPASLQKQEDHVRLAAELAYGLVLSRPGSGLVAHLPSKKGKDLVTAIMLTLAPKLKVPDPQGTIRALADKLKQAPPEVRSDLRTILAGLTKRKAALSISRYYRAVRSTAARTSLLVTGDLGPVIRILVSLGAQEAILDLLTFALSEAHLQMRRDLGISLVV